MYIYFKHNVKDPIFTKIPRYISSCSTSFSCNSQLSHLCATQIVQGAKIPDKWAKHRHVVTLPAWFFRTVWRIILYFRKPAPLHTLFWRQNRVGFAQTFFVTFQNWQSNIHPHFTLCGGKKWNWVWTSLSQPLFFHSWLNTFCHLSREQPRATLWMPSRRNHLHHYPHI